MIQQGAVLGIDVGFSARRDTTCLCLLKWDVGSITFSFEKVGVATAKRVHVLDTFLTEQGHIDAVAIDGPLTRGLRRVPHYRSAEALLSRGLFQKRGKAGQTNSPIGRELHHHATLLAEMILEREQTGSVVISRASHIEPIHDATIVEAFPNQFLAVLIHESDLPTLHRDASDRYWEVLVKNNGLTVLLSYLLPSRTFSIDLDRIKDHDQRAAAVCALTGLTVVAGAAVGVGDPENGDIFLPPTALWGGSQSRQQPWAEAALRENVATLLTSGASLVPARRLARARFHENYWIH